MALSQSFDGSVTTYTTANRATYTSDVLKCVLRALCDVLRFLCAGVCILCALCVTTLPRLALLCAQSVSAYDYCAVSCRYHSCCFC
jgi:hypothetical protein